LPYLCDITVIALDSNSLPAGSAYPICCGLHIAGQGRVPFMSRTTGDIDSGTRGAQGQRDAFAGATAGAGDNDYPVCIEPHKQFLYLVEGVL
jgi:hypothetical protein